MHMKRSVPFWLGFQAVLAVLLALALAHGSALLTQSPYDSYALQASWWLSGETSSAEDIPFLELAVYEGRYYVSFPPVPSVVSLIFLIFFKTVPSGLLTLLYALACYPPAYLLCRRSLAERASALLAAFAVLGGSFPDVAVSATHFSGGVWYQAQTLGTLCTFAALYLTGHEQRGKQALGWLCAALAVGCRPFQAVLLPFLFWQWFRAQQGLFRKRITKLLPLMVLPALAAAAMGVYNLARFGSPLEFGHNYLPEFSTEGGIQFSFLHILPNLLRVMRAPALNSTTGVLEFPVMDGFLAWLTTPLLPTAALAALRRKRGDPAYPGTVFLGVTLAAHLLLLLAHRTFGGWQYGTRYLCDLLPALLALRALGGEPPRAGECAWIGFSTAFNLWGTHAFHVVSRANGME